MWVKNSFRQESDEKPDEGYLRSVKGGFHPCKICEKKRTMKGCTTGGCPPLAKYQKALDMIEGRKKGAPSRLNFSTFQQSMTPRPRCSNLKGNQHI